MTKLILKITITDVVSGSIADIDNASELMESIYSPEVKGK